ncbi:hypothetical protein SPRG_14468 [Saprolegnia parasitica CBS 223.65]|uniref:Uncharacterized protein n=1 Tax=Saprolegnia parasitica (strain CBS 223.65) TaxID=695850 RepID=A0A067C0A4_SAPPC|nr:hypothetical protein SPRG_14468 [Saprolegnia parasitica CBS 223.65]KDO20222.1 hypothetical protein SPRG_14468 [Saprolegnia parasitica CBS 223.65]|eukprot:XP_012209035.1 hypothetical protein SPRG_14468 [Saprolegnia parasitica CBS 223.65]
MFWSLKGVATLVLCVAAAGFSWTQLVLPTWLESATESVGLTSHCVHGVCYSFSLPPNVGEMQRYAGKLLIPANTTLCAAYTGGSWNVSGHLVDGAFLDATCGSIGHAAMAMCLIQAILGTFMVAAYLTWTCAATNKSCLLALCKLLAFASLFANLLTITFWMVLKSRLQIRAGVKDGLGFVSTLVSAALFGLCVVLIGMLRLREQHEKLQSQRNLQRAKSSQKSMAAV